MTITPFYASLIAILFIVLSARVILARRAARVSLGDGGNPALLRRIRAQANCAEYAPFGLLLIAFAEFQGAPGVLVHAMALLLLGGRLLHGVAISRAQALPFGRVGGMMLTLTSLGLAAAANLVLAL